MKLTGKLSNLVNTGGTQRQSDNPAISSQKPKKGYHSSKESLDQVVAEMGVHVNLINDHLAMPLAQARFMSQVTSKKEFKVSF
jgi:hypothetical protein